MKRFSWGAFAGQPRWQARNGTFTKHEESSSEEDIYNPGGITYIHAPRPRSPKVRHGLDFEPEYRTSRLFDSDAGTWEHLVIPESPPPAPARDLNDDVSNFELSTATENSQPLPANKSFDYKHAMVSYMATGHLSSPAGTESVQGPPALTSNTIPTISITIIVTPPSPAPETDVQTNLGWLPRSPESVISRNIRKPALASADSLSCPPSSKPRLDKTRLMPPADERLHIRQRGKAEEFRSVRAFLINFLNAKGDQFPHEMRVGIMGIYKIHNQDLKPETRAKFEREAFDEGVVLHADDIGGLTKGESITRVKQRASRAESLELLKMAFRSQSLDAKLPKPESLTERSHDLNQRNRKSVPTRNQNQYRPLMKPQDVVAANSGRTGGPAWLPPQLSPLPSEHTLRVSSSVPNLQARPNRASRSKQSSSSVPNISTQSQSVTDLGLEPSSKRRLLAGALGSVRQAMRRKSRMKEVAV